MDDDAHGAPTSTARSPTSTTLKRLHPQGDGHARLLSRCCAARPSRTRACSRCSTPSSTTCPSPADREAFKGIDVKTGEPTVRKPLDSEPLSHAGLQDHGRPARGLDHLLPRLLGHRRERHGARQHHARQEGARRAHVPDARRRARADQGSLRRRHHRAAGPQGYAHRRDAVRPQQAGAAREDGVPQPRHRDEGRAQDQGRRGEDGRGAAQAGGRGPLLPRRRPTRRAARPSSRAWASCISTSRSTS